MLAKKMHLLPDGVANLVSTSETSDQGASNSAERSRAERERVLVEWNRTTAEFPRHLCIHQLLELQAQLTPDSVAVEFEDRSLSYAELDERSNQLAHFLRDCQVKPEALVGLYLDRSLEMVVAMLGVLKAGGAYIPLDPAYPSDRIKYVLEDAKVGVLITQAAVVNSLPASSAKVITLDQEWKALAGQSKAKLQVPVKPENLAYVIYTSGSTGKPKGVQVEHRNVVNFLCSMRQRPGLSNQDVLVAVTTLSFDIAGLEIYLPLLVGARLVIASRQTTYDGALLMELLNKSAATVMQATPATWRLLIESQWHGSRRLKVLVGGEALSPGLASELVSRCGAVWNMYGPTETTIWSTIYPVSGRDERTVPIGRPIANTALYILDPKREPVPVGVEGELYISGEGLARGYLGRPELNTEKFVEDPFRSVPGARMYRTGDLARYRSDGNVEFVGRVDHQVKIRGFRVELGEIEAALEQHPQIRQAVVAAREYGDGDKRLVAYIVPEPEAAVAAASLRGYLKKALPEYMLPSAFVQIAALPLTANGKVNRKALPEPKVSDYSSSEDYVPPRDRVERKLVALWEEALGVSPVGVRTSFFDLGGRSLLAARVFMKMSRVFGRDLPLAMLFEAPTIEQLANRLRAPDVSSKYSTLTAIQPSGLRPPFFCVHGGRGSTLFLHRLARELPSDQPFYGLEPEGLDGGPFRRTAVESIARHYLSEIRKIQPQGPYFIGGYCFGGLVAFAMARQLEAEGVDVPVLAMFSAPLRFNRPDGRPFQDEDPEGGEGTESRPVGKRLLRLARSPWQSIRWRMISLARRTAARWHMPVCEMFIRFGLKVPQGMRSGYVVRMTGRAERNYFPEPYSGTLLLFRGRGLYEADPYMGWNGLAGSLRIIEIGSTKCGSRRDIMNEPLVTRTAQQLNLFLESARKSLEGHGGKGPALSGVDVPCASERVAGPPALRAC